MEKNRNWVLLRGLIRGSFHWHTFPDKLAKAFPHDKVHLIDLPGNGRRNTEPSPLTIQEFTEDLRFLTRKLENIHLVAISLGGMIAMDWLVHHPHEVEHAFIMNTSLGDTGPFYKRLNYQNYPRILKSFFEDEAVIEKLILDLTCNDLRVHEQVLSHHIEMAKKYPVSRANFLRQVAAAGKTQFNSRLSEFKNLHLLVSQNDRLVHSDNSFVLASKLGISPVIHPWAGHDLTMDDPDFVVTHCLKKLGPI
jgi:pimeloyl-ACP methyl ester carboxylesterase